MSSEPNLSIKRSVSIGTVINIDSDGDGNGHGDGTCKLAFSLENECGIRNTSVCK